MTVNIGAKLCVSVRTASVFKLSDVCSQGELIEKCAGDDAFGSLSICGANKFLHSISFELFGIDDTEHATILGLLPMLVKDEESGRGGAHFKLSKVTQVHKSAFSKESKICVSKPDKELAARLLIDARIAV